MTEDAPLPPLHPGEVLREEFMVPLGLDAEALALACGAQPAVIDGIAAEHRDISGDIAIRFGRVFSTTPEFWMNLQLRFDLEQAALSLGDAVDAIKPLGRAA